MRRAVVFAAVTCGLFAIDAAAQQPVARSMTIAELQGCGVLAEEISESGPAIRRTAAALSANGKAIRIESDAIDVARRKVNLKDPKAVAAFNSRLGRNRAAIAAFDSAIKASRPAVARFNERDAAFNVGCAQRPYAKEDLARLPAAQQAAMAAESHEMSIPLVGDEAVPSRPASGSPAPYVVISSGRPLPLADDGTLGKAMRLSVDALTTAAKAGDADAQTVFGERMAAGRGLPRDPAGALVWFLKAAEQGSARAQFDAAVMLLSGDSVPAEPEKGLALMRRSAEAGFAGAQHNLALWYQDHGKADERMRQARSWMTKAADQGDPESQYILARYLRGAPGLPADLAASIQRLRASADQGFRAAQLELGEAFEKGNGVARDSVQALKWYRLAAGRTRTDPSFGCVRRIMAERETRLRAGEAADRLAARLSAYDADRAAAAADDWVAAVNARHIGGCGAS